MGGLRGSERRWGGGVHIGGGGVFSPSACSMSLGLLHSKSYESFPPFNICQSGSSPMRRASLLRAKILDSSPPTTQEMCSPGLVVLNPMCEVSH